MNSGNQTPLRECRFLNEEHFESVFTTFNEAFSDYLLPFAMTEVQFRNHINLNGVDLTQTVGCFEGERMIGCSLNGFGEWNGRMTVYDAGTGVVPSARRQGVSEAMFEMMTPIFRGQGIEQWLLEVITSNEPAIRLYRKLGFKPVRELALLQCDNGMKLSAPPPDGISLVEMPAPDRPLLRSFWAGTPSWQNSCDAMERSVKLKRVFGAFLDSRCVGYIAFSARFGRVAQIAVDKKFRGRGIGTMLLAKMGELTEPGYSLQIINLDKSLEDAMRFFRNRGFYERICQHEMLMQM
ncbi:MAG: GNAT family N-acetyltransferase [Pyrinomonadaceae bacterium]